MTYRDIRVRVRTGAPKDTISGVQNNRYAVTVRAKATANAANLRVVELIAEECGAARKDCVLISGHTHPSKTIRVYRDSH